jgi:hypothetical protein
MFAICAFREEGECECSGVQAYLCCFFFVLPKDSWENNSYWCFGLRRDEDCEYLKEGNSTIGGIYWPVFERTKKRAKYYEVGFVLEGAIDGVR